MARLSASICCALAEKKWWNRKVIITDTSTVPTMMLLPSRLPIHTVTSDPASHTPSGQPSVTPTSGVPEKKTVRIQGCQRRTCSGLATVTRARSKSRWMSTPMVRQTMKFLPYQ